MTGYQLGKLLKAADWLHDSQDKQLMELVGDKRQYNGFPIGSFLLGGPAAAPYGMAGKWYKHMLPGMAEKADVDLSSIKGEGSLRSALMGGLLGAGLPLAVSAGTAAASNSGGPLYRGDDLKMLLAMSGANGLLNAGIAYHSSKKRDKYEKIKKILQAKGLLSVKDKGV